MGKFYWNPTFTASLSDRDLALVVQHEKNHLEFARPRMAPEAYEAALAGLEAFGRREDCPDCPEAIKTAGMAFPTTVWNVAADLAVNPDVQELHSVPGLNPATGESLRAMEAVMRDFAVNRPDAAAYCVDVSGSVQDSQLAWAGEQVQGRLRAGDVVLMFDVRAAVVVPEDGESYGDAFVRLRREGPVGQGGTCARACVELARSFTVSRLVAFTDGMMVREDVASFDEIVSLP